jgi:hypothetical protein
MAGMMRRECGCSEFRLLGTRGIISTCILPRPTAMLLRSYPIQYKKLLAGLSIRGVHSRHSNTREQSREDYPRNPTFSMDRSRLELVGRRYPACADPFNT